MIAITSFKPPTDGLGRREHFDLPALRLGVAGVHAEHFGGEERGLVAAGAGADFQDDVFLVVRILGQQQNLEFFFHAADARFQFVEFFLGVGAHVGIFFVGQHSLALGDARASDPCTRDISRRWTRFRCAPWRSSGILAESFMISGEARAPASVLRSGLRFGLVVQTWEFSRRSSVVGRQPRRSAVALFNSSTERVWRECSRGTR